MSCIRVGTFLISRYRAESRSNARGFHSTGCCFAPRHTNSVVCARRDILSTCRDGTRTVSQANTCAGDHQ